MKTRAACVLERKKRETLLTVRGYDADVPLLAPDARAVDLLGLDRLGEIDLLDLLTSEKKRKEKGQPTEFKQKSGGDSC